MKPNYLPPFRHRSPTHICWDVSWCASRERGGSWEAYTWAWDYLGVLKEKPDGPSRIKVVGWVALYGVESWKFFYGNHHTRIC